ncbi:MAG TPA: hypothetical protein VGZ29_09875 [Terriglobia bacterium]|nr:hypothetical protein [Terriglobia bacterium]
MNKGKRTGFLVALAVVVAAFFAILPVSRADDTATQDSEEVSKLLAEVKAETHELEKDAENLSAWTRAKNISWEGHTGQTELIREHVNKTGRLLTELQNAREGASPWQQKAIDEIHPALKSLADNTRATITLLSENKSRIHANPEYRDLATANYDLARELAALVTEYIDYGKHQAEFQRLHEKLQVSAD